MTKVLKFTGRNGSVTVDIITTDDVGNEPNKIPKLDGYGKLDESVIPVMALGQVFEVSDESDMLLLNAVGGDIAKRTDLGVSYALKESPASNIQNWVQLSTPAEKQLEYRVTSMDNSVKVEKSVSQDIVSYDVSISAALERISQLESKGVPIIVNNTGIGNLTGINVDDV